MVISGMRRRKMEKASEHARERDRHWVGRSVGGWVGSPQHGFPPSLSSCGKTMPHRQRFFTKGANPAVLICPLSSSQLASPSLATAEIRGQPARKWTSPRHGGFESFHTSDPGFDHGSRCLQCGRFSATFISTC